MSDAGDQTGTLTLESFYSDLQRGGERFIEVTKSARWKGAHKVGERRLGQTDELVAVDSAIVLESLRGTYWDLGRQPVANRINGRADDRGEPRFD